MTNVLELLTDDNSQPLYALALPFATNNGVSELQTEYLQNQLQSLVNQAQQGEDISNVENASEVIDTLEKAIPEDASHWASLPIYSAGENSLNIQTLDQSMINGITGDIPNIEYMIEEDVECATHTAKPIKEFDNRYMISLNGMQYDFKLVPSTGQNGTPCSQLKILLNTDNITEENSTLSNAILASNLNSYDYQPVLETEIDDIADVVQAYKCRKCCFTVEDKKLLRDHYKTEHSRITTIIKKEGFMDIDNCCTNNFDEIEVKSEQLLYMCGQCTQGYESIDECKEHMIKDHKLTRRSSETDISCDFESKDLSNEICLPTKTDESYLEDTKESHWMLINSIKELKNALISGWDKKCTVNGCSYRFKDDDCLEKHCKCHKILSKQFSCSECNEDFNNWRACSTHLWRTHLIDVDMLTCPICSEYKTSTTVKLNHHMKIHGLSKSYVCGECGKAFKQPGQLHNHKVLHIARKKTQIQRWYTAKKCEICLKSFANSKCLKKHIQAIHSKIRPFICNVCGHSCTRKAMLQMHLRQHTGEKPYACTECDYRTSDHNTLRRHLMRHTGDRPYRCSYCPYAAIQSCAFKWHMKTKHKDKPGVYSCTECSFKTININIYESHVSDHKRGLIDLDKKDRINWKLNPDQNNGYVVPQNNEMNNLTSKMSSRDSEDDDTQHCFLIRHQNNDNSNDAIDTGGVTIPADTCT